MVSISVALWRTSGHPGDRWRRCHESSRVRREIDSEGFIETTVVLEDLGPQLRVCCHWGDRHVLEASGVMEVPAVDQEHE